MEPHCIVRKIKTWLFELQWLNGNYAAISTYLTEKREQTWKHKPRHWLLLLLLLLLLVLHLPVKAAYSYCLPTWATASYCKFLFCVISAIIKLFDHTPLLTVQNNTSVTACSKYVPHGPRQRIWWDWMNSQSSLKNRMYTEWDITGLK